MSYFRDYEQAFGSAVHASEATVGSKPVTRDEWLSALGELTTKCQSDRGRFLFAGNGASAAFASHMSLDWSKNGGVPCIPLLDPAHLTALGNDLGYDEVFAAPIGWHGTPADVLVTISSSGNSANILRAIEAAREAGMKVVTFSGLNPDNASRSAGDINIYVPAKTYGVVECAHQLLLHMWLDSHMDVKEWDRDAIQNMRSDDFQA